MAAKGKITVLIANPSSDVYGSDLQMLQSVAAMKALGWRVVVAVPTDGALVPRLRELGAEIEFVSFPVLRRANMSPKGMLTLISSVTLSLARIRVAILRVAPDVVYVNTVTLPWWLLVPRVMRLPAICHVHEAEARDREVIKKALTAPLRLATAVIANGGPALDVMLAAAPRLRAKAHVIYNGVPSPPEAPAGRRLTAPFRLVVVGRLSPRKAPHVALEATALLRSRGFDVEIELCGTAFEGYEWYVDQLRARAGQDDLLGAVTLSGYQSPIWPALVSADIAVAPSFGESLGNAVVEAQYCQRPVVATAVQGHLETVVDEETGLLVPPDDAEALSLAIERLIGDEALVSRLARTARKSALSRFGTERYGREITDLILGVRKNVGAIQR